MNVAAGIDRTGFRASVPIVLFGTGHKNPSLAFRFTAVLAVLLIVALSIFAASPVLHHWVHAREHSGIAKSISAADSTHAPAHPIPEHATDDHDDGCAIALFAAGVLSVLSAFLVWLFCPTHADRCGLARRPRSRTRAARLAAAALRPAYELSCFDEAA